MDLSTLDDACALCAHKLYVALLDLLGAPPMRQAEARRTAVIVIRDVLELYLKLINDRESRGTL